MLEWQRERKKEYNKTPEMERARAERRAERKKVCAYCLREFWTSTSSNVCSEYCREQHRRLKQCEADVRRGYDRSLEEYLEKRKAYRENVKDKSGTLSDSHKD